MAIWKPTPSAPLIPVIEASEALQHTFGSLLKGLAHTTASPIPPHRPKMVVARKTGHRLSQTTPRVLSNPRLKSQVRATAHPDIIIFPPHPPLPLVTPSLK
jgi:hypothetical protein